VDLGRGYVGCGGGVVGVVEDAAGWVEVDGEDLDEVGTYR